MNVRLTIAYDGSCFFGWQKTQAGPSVESTLEDALKKILGHSVHLQAASRTDAGVHARGQVVNFFITEDLPLKTLQERLNEELNPIIAIRDISIASDDFHPTLDNLGKEYHYLICNDPTHNPFLRHIAWHYPHPLDIQAMQQAARFLLGTHDFSAFCNDRAQFTRDPICTLYSCHLVVHKDHLEWILIGNRFLYRMVRNLIGTLVYVGCGKIAPEEIPSILSNRQRIAAGITAPAHGLHLVQVFYSPFL